LKYFREEVLRFRDYTSDKRRTRDQREKAFKALTFVYLTAKCQNPSEDVDLVNLFEIVSAEYTRRETMLMFLDLRQARQTVDA